MKKLLYILWVAGMIAAAPVVAQSTFSIQYSIGTGSGDTRSFISSPSFRGAALEYRRMLQPKIGVGADVGWNVFYERRAYDTYTSGTMSLSGVQFRYINAAPIFLAFDYYMKPDQKVNPFFGLGVGTLFIRQNTNMNLYTIEYNSWAFALRPEAGIRYEMNPGLDFIFAAKYNYGFATDKLSAQSYFTFNVGFVFKGN
jgi:outer membrane protein W